MALYLSRMESPARVPETVGSEGRFSRLPDHDQTPFDVDFIMSNASDSAFDYELYRASNKARWKLNPELVREVEQEAIELSRAFAVKVSGKPGITLFDHLEAVEAALFPKSVK